MDLNKIGRCMPLKRKKTGEQLGSARYLEIIDSIFLGRELDCSSLIDQFMEVARILKFERKGYNVSNEGKLEDKLLQQNFLLTFLKKMEILGGEKMEEKNTAGGECGGKIPEEIEGYWHDVGIYSDNRKKALFLLGYLVGEIGREQSSGRDRGKEPILEKINFQGMGREKILRLKNDVFVGLKNYRLLQYDEGIFLHAVGCWTRPS